MRRNRTENIGTMSHVFCVCEFSWGLQRGNMRLSNKLTELLVGVECVRESGGLKRGLR